MNNEEYTRAIIVSDESGHDYLIPYDLNDHFQQRLEECEDAENLVSCAETDEEYQEALKVHESMYNYSSFDEEFGDYRVEGEVEIYAKFN